MPSFPRSLAFISIFALSMACTTKDRSPSSLKSTFHGTMGSDFVSLDPPRAWTDSSTHIIANINESLYQYAYLKKEATPEPLLAATLPKISRDRLTVTIPIKKGVRFTDDPCFKETAGKGRELTVHDVIYSFKRHALPKLMSDGWWGFDGKIVGFNAFRDRLAKTSKEELASVFDEPIDGLKALDSHTLQIKLTQPYPQLAHLLTIPLYGIVAREAVEKYANPDGIVMENPVGTGPFVLAERKRGLSVRLDRNPTFRLETYPSQASPEFARPEMLSDAGKALPLLDSVEFRIVREERARWLSFLKGQLETSEIPKDEFDFAIQDINENLLTPELVKKGIRIATEPTFVLIYLSVNMKDPLLGKNKRLREALSSAIHREEWIRLFTNGTASKITSALPPGVPDRPDSTVARNDFDLARAKRLLREAGYPEGKGLPTIELELGNSNTTARQKGEFLARQFAAIGVPIQLSFSPWPVFLEKRKTGRLQLFHDGWTMDYPDAENVYLLLYGPNRAPGPNIGFFENTDYDRLYEKIAVMSSSPERKRLIRRMDEIIQEEVPWIMLHNPKTSVLHQHWLKNYRSSDTIRNRFKYLRIERR